MLRVVGELELDAALDETDAQALASTLGAVRAAGYALDLESAVVE